MTGPKLFFTGFVLLFCLKVTGQTYQVSSIPDSLKANANLVIRDESTQLTIKSYNSGTEKVVQVLTILNRNGEDLATLVLNYNKNSSVDINEITYYDESGKKIKSIKQSEITDAPAFGSSQLFSESRLKYFKPAQPVYPYTVKYDYDISMEKSLSFGVWHPYSSYNISTVRSNYIVKYPTDLKINIKEINIKRNATKIQDSYTVETWDVTNLKALESEPLSNSINERVPSVYIMPSVLMYEKYEGKADNWSDYGRWIRALYDGRDNIADAEKIKVEELIKNIPDTIGKIKTLYSYLQQNTRYVAITLGLGGFQPFDAATVTATGYGDCKALSNYMFSLLKMIGITSYPALVSSGRYQEKIFTDFPNFHQFDHVILCVPLHRDSLWLECTDQKIPFGFLGDFTDDRDVLLLTETGGKFAHTPRYGLKENLRSCRSEFVIDSTGATTCNLKTTYKGLQYDDISDFLGSNYDEQKKWLYSNSSLPSLQIRNFSVKESRESIPSVEINESVLSKNYCSFSGKYMLMPLNYVNAQKSIPKMLKSRLADIVINRSEAECDTMVFKIPKNFNCESLPQPVNISSSFGNYSLSVSAAPGQIICIRKFTILKGSYKSSEYKTLYDFILAISKADNSKIMLSKKT